MTQSLGVRDLLFPEERKGSFCLLTLLSLHYETVMTETVHVPTLWVVHLLKAAQTKQLVNQLCLIYFIKVMDKLG